MRALTSLPGLQPMLPEYFLLFTSGKENDDTYQCQFLNGIKSGTETIAQARHRMIASSPIYFAANLSKTQMHMAADDTIVPVAQGTDMKDKMNILGLSSLFELFIYEGRDHSNIGTDNIPMNQRIDAFLSDQ